MSTYYIRSSVPLYKEHLYGQLLVANELHRTEEFLILLTNLRWIQELFRTERFLYSEVPYRKVYLYLNICIPRYSQPYTESIDAFRYTQSTACIKLNAQAGTHHERKCNHAISAAAFRHVSAH